MPEFVISENGVDRVVFAESAPDGAIPVEDFLAAMVDDESLAGIVPEASSERDAPAVTVVMVDADHVHVTSSAGIDGALVDGDARRRTTDLPAGEPVAFSLQKNRQGHVTVNGEPYEYETPNG